ncbi:MAG TPA: enoyl-CoA hydratase/isomerase family protein [Caulobacteraceae bacterium]|jgi:enoyl-CoA hydratase|nr:enoyl-CoA hydratase/isomerase family protein [Caulobacteraceae bacterium]
MSDEPPVEAEVICRREAGVGRITLNRPRALHALTLPMVEAMTAALLDWRSDSAVEAVLIDHSGERGFCAGGDIRFLADSASQGGAGAREFFFKEYQLNHLLMVFGKPVVALMDGVTMGGGVGISLPASVRIATERTRFAMPETGIGLFPDVGAGWHLPRLPGQSGLWLALTGARLEAADCRRLGIATHVIRSEDAASVKEAVISAPGSLETILGPYDLSPPEAPIEHRLGAIDRLFGHDSVEAIFAALEADGSDFASSELAALKTKSPLTMKVALRQLAEGSRMHSFADEMVQEMRIGARMVMSRDFAEGVRAVIVEKDNAPRWDPPRPEAVTHAMLEEVFAPLKRGEGQEWTPLPQVADATGERPAI